MSIPNAAIATLLGAFIVSFLLGIVLFLRNRRKPILDRILLAILPVCGTIAFLLAVRHIVYTLFPSWSGVRLAFIAAIRYGYSYYYPPDTGPVMGFLYPPLYPFSYLPVTFLFSSPTALVLAGSSLGFLYALLPQIWLYFRREPGSTKDPIGNSARLVCFALFTGTLFSLSYAIFPVRSEAPMLALCAFAAVPLLRRGDLSWAGALVSATLLALAIWTKQTALPAALAMPLYLLLADGRRSAFRFLSAFVLALVPVSSLFVLGFGGKILFFNLVQYPSRHNWFRYTCFVETEGGSDCSIATTFLQRLISMAWMAQHYLNEYLAVVLTACLVAGVSLLFALHENPVSLREWFATRRWLVFFCMSAALAPMGIANRVKVGGEDSAFAGCLYFLATGLLLGLRDWSRLPYYGERLAKGVLLLLLLLYSALALPKFASFPGLLANLPHNPQQSAYDYLKSHPGRAFFPWTPLAALLAEGAWRAASRSLSIASSGTGLSR